MSRTVATRINNSLARVEDRGKTLVFDLSVTMANIHGKRLHARQSTSSLIPPTDTSVDLSRSVSDVDFWVIPDLEIKHFLMIQAPHDFFLDITDSNLQNSVSFEVKRLHFFAGKFSGRLTLRSDIEQLIAISYA